MSTKESLSNSWLVLDVDGVLLDPSRGGLGAWTVEFSSHFKVNADELRGAFFEPYWDEIVIGRREVAATLGAVLQRLGWDFDVDEVLACWFESDFIINHEVVDTVVALASRGVSIAVATNQEHRRAKFLHERLASLVPLRGFVYSAQLGRTKRDSRFFTDAQQRLGLPTELRRVVFVDDSLSNVRSAQIAKWNAVHFDAKFDWYEHVEVLLSSNEPSG
jgi:putative hydrolase of the HAD superfamily